MRHTSASGRFREGRIIADLHDDVGGGLSSIRMMSDLMSHQGTLDKNQASFAEKISMTAKDIAQRIRTYHYMEPEPGE